MEKEEKKREEGKADEKKSKVGTGDRSEKKKQYNYQKGKITDKKMG
ncbi:hypothetical protein [Clostridium sp. ZBS13]|nr:hypothetical protein [Clostridium sp. ZBS13]